MWLPDNQLARWANRWVYLLISRRSFFAAFHFHREGVARSAGSENPAEHETERENGRDVEQMRTGRHGYLFCC